jgi:hypothetical protein
VSVGHIHIYTNIPFVHSVYLAELKLKGGRIPGGWASIVLSDPGGPIMKKLCAPGITCLIPGGTENGISFLPVYQGFPYVSGPLRNGPFSGCTTENVRCPLFSNSTHVCEGASRARFFSLDDYHFTDCLGWDSAQSILATVFEN